MRMNEQIAREENVHGKPWDAVHGGYFSDPAVAAPLVRIVKDLALRSHADVVADLGGGNGFLLSQLVTAGIGPGISLVNLDGSPVQLDAAQEAGFACVRGSVDSFSRHDVIPRTGCGLFMMRSVLHYFGQDGLRPVLRHLRSQALAGEFFVHQTASFRRREDADGLNELYELMRTEKWYPDVDTLCDGLTAEGWRVLDVRPAAPLRLTSDELARRYHLDPADISRIRARLGRRSDLAEDVFSVTDDGFRAYLHYWIYRCTPGEHG